MKEFCYTITDPEGIHARPAGELVKKAKSYLSKVTLYRAEKSGDCKKIFAVMSLGVKSGQEVRVTIDGEDEEKACRELQTFFEENL